MTDRVPMMWGRGEQVSLMVAGLDLAPSFQRTLMPRALGDQAVVTGLNSVLVSSLAAGIQNTVQSAALALVGGSDGTHDELRWSRATLGLDAAAVVAGMAVQRMAGARPGEHLGRAALRSSGWKVAEIGAAGVIVGLFQEVLSGGGRRRPRLPVVVPATLLFGAGGEVRRRRREAADQSVPPPESELPFGKALAMSAAVAVGTAGFSVGRRRLARLVGRSAARHLPGDERYWRPIGDALTLGGLVVGGRATMRFLYHRVEDTAAATEPAYDLPPILDHVSGGTASLVPYDSMSTQGRRFVWTARTAERISEVLHEPGRDAVRVFVGLETAPTPEKRVAAALDELERLGAFERSWLLVVSPTGTGYVNYAAVGCFEFLTRGDCATVAMQYSLRPSVMSLDRLGQARRDIRQLLVGLHERLEARPADARPRVMLFGESLGAWASQDAFLHGGTLALQDRGIERAIWIGTPHESGWKRQVFGAPRPDVDRRLVGEFNDLAELEELDDEAREALRYVLITHGNDGVACLGPELAVQAPPWLGPAGERPKGVPAGMRWQVLTTFLQVVVDMKNSMQVVPGVFAANGHDYRADLPGFFREVLGIPTSDRQLADVVAALESDERIRARWIGEARETGGMSEIIARRAVEANRGAVQQLLLERRREMELDRGTSRSGA